MENTSFKQFLEQMKERWKGYLREFGEENQAGK